MPRRGRAASPPRAAPRAYSPPPPAPSRNTPMAAPPSAPAPAMAQPQQPSMFKQMAATAGEMDLSIMVVTKINVCLFLQEAWLSGRLWVMLLVTPSPEEWAGVAGLSLSSLSSNNRHNQLTSSSSTASRRSLKVPCYSGRCFSFLINLEFNC